MILRLPDSSEKIWKSNGSKDSMELLITLFLDFPPLSLSPYHHRRYEYCFFNTLCFMISSVMTYASGTSLIRRKGMGGYRIGSINTPRGSGEEKQKSHSGENLEAMFSFFFPFLTLSFPSFLPDFLLIPHPLPYYSLTKQYAVSIGLDWIRLKPPRSVLIISPLGYSLLVPFIGLVGG